MADPSPSAAGSVRLMESLARAERNVASDVENAFAGLPILSADEAVANAIQLGEAIDARRTADADYADRVAIDRLRLWMAWTAYVLIVLITLVALVVIATTVLRRDYQEAGVTAVGLPPLIALFAWTWRFIVNRAEPSAGVAATRDEPQRARSRRGASSAAPKRKRSLTKRSAV